MSFLSNLDELMRAKNINRSELARGIGLSTSTVNSWYNRSYENISLKTLRKLAKYFDITLEELVYGPTRQIINTDSFTPDEIVLINAYARFLKNNRK